MYRLLLMLIFCCIYSVYFFVFLLSFHLYACCHICCCSLFTRLLMLKVDSTFFFQVFFLVYFHSLSEQRVALLSLINSRACCNRCDVLAGPQSHASNYNHDETRYLINYQNEERLRFCIHATVSTQRKKTKRNQISRFIIKFSVKFILIIIIVFLSFLS